MNFFSGTYKCQVKDWGVIQEQSVTIQVITPPRVAIIPMALTVSKGENVSILCLCGVHYNTKIGYHWVKNDVILDFLKGPEIVEDIFPSGSRMTILGIESSATYTCIASGMSGETKVSSRITVIHPSTPPLNHSQCWMTDAGHLGYLTHGFLFIVKLDIIGVCPPEKNYNVVWSQAAPNSYDVKPCPDFRGNVTRLCTNLDGQSTWEEPDFSYCRSPTMIKLKQLVSLFDFRIKWNIAHHLITITLVINGKELK